MKFPEPTVQLLGLKKKKKTVVYITKLWKWLLLGTGRRLQHTACGILAAPSEMRALPEAVQMQSVNHWTAREGPQLIVLIK